MWIFDTGRYDEAVGKAMIHDCLRNSQDNIMQTGDVRKSIAVTLHRLSHVV